MIPGFASTEDIKLGLQELLNQKMSGGNVLNAAIEIPDQPVTLDASKTTIEPPKVNLRVLKSDMNKITAEDRSGEPKPAYDDKVNNDLNVMLKASGNQAFMEAREGARQAAALDPANPTFKALAASYDRRAAEKFGLKNVAELGQKSSVEQQAMVSKELALQVQKHDRANGNDALAQLKPEQQAELINKKEVMRRNERLQDPERIVRIELNTPKMVMPHTFERGLDNLAQGHLPRETMEVLRPNVPALEADAPAFVMPVNDHSRPNAQRYAMAMGKDVFAFHDQPTPDVAVKVGQQQTIKQAPAANISAPNPFGSLGG